MELKGTIIANLGVQKGTSKQGKEWSKATIVIETEGQYPKKVALDNMKNAESFSTLTIGMSGTFHIEVESREFNGRWYSSVSCWKWETAQPAPAPQAAYPTTQQPAYAPTQPAPSTPPADDLPF